jgi:hypothetical protein
MRRWMAGMGAAALAASLAIYSACGSSKAQTPSPGPGGTSSDAVKDFASKMIDQGRDTFRNDTFGDEAFWTGQIKLNEGLAQNNVTPTKALAVGLKVDVDALDSATVNGLKAGTVDLNNIQTTLALLKANAVVGVKATVNGNAITSFGITCAICHSNVDDSLTAGIGHRRDGWPNRDLDVGKIVNLAADLQPVATLLGVDVATLKGVLAQWGPGMFDAEVFMDGKALGPDGKPHPTLIPAAFGLAGVNLHTYTGWGSVTHWNAFVANLEMHGVGNFFDPRLDDAAKFPIAAKPANHFGHVTVPLDKDQITSKLAALHLYQLSLDAPKPPDNSFNKDAAARGKATFEGKAKCATCHIPPLYTEPGWNMHTAQEIGIDDFQAKRAPDERYRTTPLRGLWARMQAAPVTEANSTTGRNGHGFYHDGRFPTLMDVVNHYDQTMSLGLTTAEKQDLVEYLKSI